MISTKYMEILENRKMIFYLDSCSLVMEGGSIDGTDFEKIGAKRVWFFGKNDYIYLL